jgi:glycosyltransferase involved in cell wall biosynthesis
VVALRAVLEACPRLTDRAHIIPHGVDLRTWAFRTRPFTPHDELRLFSAGRFVEKKGLDTLLRGAAILQRRGTPVNVSLAGSGPFEEPLRRLAEELQLGAAVSWLGVLTPDQVRQALGMVDVLVVPSRVSRGGDRDGIPNIVLEAMAVGVPVVGTGAGGLLEVLNSRTGWPFPPDDYEALAQVLQTIALRPQGAEQRRQTARAMVEERYDAARLAEQRAGLFHGVLSGAE